MDDIVTRIKELPSHEELSWYSGDYCEGSIEVDQLQALVADYERMREALDMIENQIDRVRELREMRESRGL